MPVSARKSESGDATAAPILKIGHIAQMLGVSAARIRAWEDEGLIVPFRTDSGQRRYSMHDYKHLERVRRLMSSGEMTLAGVRAMLGVAEEPANGTVNDPPTAQDIGSRAKGFRRQAGLSLRDLAALTGMSPSALSAFERGISSPNVGRLSQIAHAIGVTTNDILGVGFRSGSLVVRHDQRTRIVDSSGVIIENLYSSPTALQSQMVTVQPGCGSGHPMTHDGEEFLTVIDGALEVVLDGIELYRLGVGDSMSFASSRSHSYRNHGDILARVVWVNTPPTF